MINDEIKLAYKLNDLVIYWAWGFSLVVEHVLSMGMALASILSMEERKKICKLLRQIFIIFLLMY